VTLAEFNMLGYQGQTFYDISLVDGYNLAMGIIAVFDRGRTPNVTPKASNLTNPICIGTSSFLTAVSDNADQNFGNTTASIALEEAMTVASVQSWCPFPLLLLPPQKPGDGVYPYPDDNIQRPIFSPCLSACARWGKAQYCCTGSYGEGKCKPSYYSSQAKKVCPDAYSYAYDDALSTFTVPNGYGFEVQFCPVGRSSNILVTSGSEVAPGGSSQAQLMMRDVEKRNDATPMAVDSSTSSLLALVVLLACMCFW
jgi:hypothetical protein